MKVALLVLEFRVPLYVENKIDREVLECALGHLDPCKLSPAAQCIYQQVETEMNELGAGRLEPCKLSPNAKDVFEALAVEELRKTDRATHCLVLVQKIDAMDENGLVTQRGKSVVALLSIPRMSCKGLDYGGLACKVTDLFTAADLDK